MGNFKLAVVFLLCNGFILFFAAHAKAQEVPESEIDKIIKEALVDSQKGAISNYTYQMKFTYSQHRLMGRKFTRLYEAILPSRFATNYQHPLLLLEDSEKDIPTSQVLNARKDLAKKLESEENNADKNATVSDQTEDGGYWTVQFTANGKRIHVDIVKLLKNVTFSNLTRQNVGGKGIIAIDFSPKTEADFEKSLSYLSQIEGQVLIDETDKRIIRIEGFAPGEYIINKDKTDAERERALVLFFAQTKVSEGFWFPQTVRLNLSILPNRREADEVEFSFNKYNKSRVDVKETLEKPVDPNTPRSVPPSSDTTTQKPNEIPAETVKPKSADSPNDKVKQTSGEKTKPGSN